MFQSKVFYDPENLMDIFDNVHKPQCKIHSIENATLRPFSIDDKRILWPLISNEAETEWAYQRDWEKLVTIISPCCPVQATEISKVRQETARGEAIFAIDCVLKEIFVSLDIKSLINCRRVSCLWNYFASKQLQKMVTIEFAWNCLSHRYSFVKTNKRLQERLSLCPGQGLKSLVPLMQSSSSFPCTSFKFNSPNFIYTIARVFFSEFGTHLTKLELTGGKRNAPIFFEYLKEILLDLAPNLEHLAIDCIVRGKVPLGPDAFSLYEPDATTNIQNTRPKLNLKILEFKRKIERRLFQELLEFCPKLVEIKIEEIRDLAVLNQPLDCFLLLKSLKLIISRAMIDFQVILFGLKVSSWAAVKKLYFDSSHFQKFTKALQGVIIEITHRILWGVAPYIEKVVWGDVSCLEEAVKFPEMPKVKEIVLSLLVYKTFFGEHVFTKRFYPPGIKLQRIFRNLETVHLFNHTAPRDARVPIMLSPSDVVRSVRRVIVYGMPGTGIFPEMFPNATIVFKEPGRFRNSYWDVINF